VHAQSALACSVLTVDVDLPPPPPPATPLPLTMVAFCRPFKKPQVVGMLPWSPTLTLVRIPVLLYSMHAGMVNTGWGTTLIVAVACDPWGPLLPAWQLQGEMEAGADKLRAREASLKDAERAVAAAASSQRDRAAELERRETQAAQRERVRNSWGGVKWGGVGVRLGEGVGWGEVGDGLGWGGVGEGWGRVG
jgi:hypothetical protein